LLQNLHHYIKLHVNLNHYKKREIIDQVDQGIQILEILVFKSFVLIINQIHRNLVHYYYFHEKLNVIHAYGDRYVH